MLLPGDPGRALRLAQALLREPKMFNHNRGLWGYTGLAADDEPMTIQSTGMGGPSAAIVVTELALLGARRVIRVGTCGALEPALGLGELLLAREAIAGDGTSRALGSGARAAAHAELSGRLAAAAPGLAQGAVLTTDLFYDNEDLEARGARDGALAVEMETAAVFTVSASKGLAAASLLIVTDQLVPERSRIDADALAGAELRAGQIAVAALLGQD